MNYIQFKSMSFIFKLLLKLDILSPNYSFEYNSSHRHTSTTGVIYSLIAFIITIAYSLYFLIPILNREINTFYSFDQYISKSVINLNAFPVFFSFSNIKSLSDDYKAFFTITMNKIQIDKSGNIKTTSFNKDVLRKCNKIEYTTSTYLTFNKSEYLQEDLAGIYCLNHMNISIDNEINSLDSSFIYITFDICDPTTDKSCPKDIEDIINNIYLIISYIKPYINSNEYTSPVNFQEESYRIRFDRSIVKRLSFRFINGWFMSDNGLFAENKKMTNFLTLYQKDIDYNSVNLNENRHRFTFEMDSIRLCRYYNRIYPRIQDGLSQMGGVFSFVIAIMRIISQYHLRIEYLSFVNKLIFNEDNEKGSEIKSDIKSDINSNRNSITCKEVDNVNNNYNIGIINNKNSTNLQKDKEKVSIFQITQPVTKLNSNISSTYHDNDNKKMNNSRKGSNNDSNSIRLFQNYVKKEKENKTKIEKERKIEEKPQNTRRISRIIENNLDFNSNISLYKEIKSLLCLNIKEYHMIQKEKHRISEYISYEYLLRLIKNKN